MAEHAATVMLVNNLQVEVAVLDDETFRIALQKGADVLATIPVPNLNNAEEIGSTITGVVEVAREKIGPTRAQGG